MLLFPSRMPLPLNPQALMDGANALALLVPSASFTPLLLPRHLQHAAATVLTLIFDVDNISCRWLDSCIYEHDRKIRILAISLFLPGSCASPLAPTYVVQQRTGGMIQKLGIINSPICVSVKRSKVHNLQQLSRIAAIAYRNFLPTVRICCLVCCFHLDLSNVLLSCILQNVYCRWNLDVG